VEDVVASEVETEGATTEEAEAMDMEAEEGAPHGTHNLTNGTQETTLQPDVTFRFCKMISPISLVLSTLLFERFKF
jgi:hypothetical protein